MTLGTNAKMAFAKASAWGTAVTLAANHRRPFIRDTIDPRRGMIDDETLLGVSTRNPAQRGDLDVQGQLEWHGDFRQNILMWALILGTAGTPTEVESAVAYKHVLKLKNSTSGLFATYGKDDGVEAFELAGFKPNQLVLTSEEGGGFREVLTPVAGGLDEDGVSSSAWTFANDPSEDGAEIIKHRQGVFRCNAQGGAALDGDDVLYPTRFDLSINRNLESKPGMNDNVEPMPGTNSWTEVQLTLEFDEYTAALLALFYDALKGGEAGTLLKADYVFTGVDLPSTAASNKYQRDFYFPSLRVIEAPREIPGPGKLPARVVMTAHKADADPSGFSSGYQEEVIVEVQNAETADYLA